MHKTHESLFAVALAMLVVGCAGQGSGPDGAPGDDEVDGDLSSVDAGALDATPMSACPASLDYGAATLSAQKASGEGAPNARANLDAIGNFDGVAQLDQLNALMYSNEGAFGDTLPTGTFDLSGIESDFATCGLCVMLYAGVGVTLDDVYMPTEGTMTITRYDPTFQATITNLRMRHVEVDPSTFATTPHPDGCTSSIGSAAFDVAIINE